MLVRVDLKSDRSLISGCARVGQEYAAFIPSRWPTLSAAGCLPVRNKHDQRRPINRVRYSEKGRLYLRAKVRRKHSKLHF